MATLGYFPEDWFKHQCRMCCITRGVTTTLVIHYWHMHLLHNNQELMKAEGSKGRPTENCALGLLVLHYHIWLTAKFLTPIHNLQLLCNVMCSCNNLHNTICAAPCSPHAHNYTVIMSRTRQMNMPHPRDIEPIS